jgi:hypothetical protein
MRKEVKLSLYQAVEVHKVEVEASTFAVDNRLTDGGEVVSLNPATAL